MRTYITHPGRLDALNARFRDHTNKLFKKHGMELVGYWTPQAKEEGHARLHPRLPEPRGRRGVVEGVPGRPRLEGRAEASEKDGKIVEKVESVFLDPTDYSPIK